MAATSLLIAGTPARGTQNLAGLIFERVRGLVAGRDILLDVMLPAGSETNVQPVADAFTRETGVRVATTTVPVDDINSRLILASSLDRRVDLALPATFGIPDLAEAGALLPLDGLQAKLGADLPDERSLFWLGDYYNGRLYGFQTDGDVYVMFYNRSILHDPALREEYRERVGTEPKPADSWQELDRMLAFYHRPAQGLYGGCLFRTPRYIAWEYWIRLHAKGLTPFDADMCPQISGLAGIEAAEELTQTSAFLTENSKSASLFENWKTFSAGNVMCNIGWGGSQKYFQTNAANFDDGLIIAPTPSGDAHASRQEFSYFNWGWNYAVPRTSRHPEIAYLFARFAVLPGSSADAVSAPDGFFDPFHDRHYADPRIARIYGPAFLDVHRQSMQTAIPDLYLRGQSQYISVLSDYLLRVDRRDITPQAALQTVSRQWEELTNSLGRSEQIRQWRLLLERYPDRFRAA